MFADRSLRGHDPLPASKLVSLPEREGWNYNNSFVIFSLPLGEGCRIATGKGSVVTYTVTSVVTCIVTSIEKRSLSGSRINTGMSAQLVTLGGISRKL